MTAEPRAAAHHVFAEPVALDTCHATGDVLPNSSALSPVIGPRDDAGTHRMVELELRLQSTEAELARTKHHAALLTSLLQEAKVSLQQLGEEADAESSDLQAQLEATQAELSSALAESRAAPSKTGTSVDALAAQAASLRAEVRALRVNEEASWEQSTWTHQEFAAGLMALRERVEAYQESVSVSGPPGSQDRGAAAAEEARGHDEAMELRRQCAAYEEALERQVEVVQSSEEEAVMLRRACAEEVRRAREAQESAEEAYADAELQRRAAVTAKTSAQTQAAGAENACASLTTELNELAQELARLQESESSAEDVRAECNQLRRDIDDSRAEAHWHAEQLAKANEELLASQSLSCESPPARLDCAGDLDFQTEVDKQLQSARQIWEEELQAESAACQQAREAGHAESMVLVTRAAQQHRADRATSRWCFFVLRLGKKDALERLRLCKAAWRAGSRKSHDRIAQLKEQLRVMAASAMASKRVERKLEQTKAERQSEQEEDPDPRRSRRASVESLPESKGGARGSVKSQGRLAGRGSSVGTEKAVAPRSSLGSRAGAPKTPDPQANWRSEMRELAMELQEAKGSATRAQEEAFEQRARANAAVEQLNEATASANSAKGGAPPEQSATANRELEAEVLQLRQSLASAEEAIGILVAGGSVGGDGGSGGPSGASSTLIGPSG